MSGAAEAVLGEIPAIVHLRIGSEMVKLYVTGRRIIVAHKVKKGRGALAVSSLLGRIGGSPDEPFKRGLPVGGKGEVDLSPDKILGAHRDNFALGYDELVGVELQEDSEGTKIVVLTREDKFEFSTRLNLVQVSDLLGPHLGDRLTGRRVRT